MVKVVLDSILKKYNFYTAKISTQRLMWIVFYPNSFTRANANEV